MSARPKFIETTDSAWLKLTSDEEAKRTEHDRQVAISVRQMRAADADAKAAARRARGSIWFTRWNDKREEMRPWGADDLISVIAVVLLIIAIVNGWVFGGAA